MADLSPAQKIVAAFNERHELCGPFDDDWVEQCLAAALRAAADQVVPEVDLHVSVANDLLPKDIGAAKWSARYEVRCDLLAIATELETHR